MYKQFFKRLIDLLLSFIGILVLALPMLVIAVIIKIDSPGPVFFKQKRVGWSIIGQKSGAALGIASRPALSALEAKCLRHLQVEMAVAA